MAKQTQKPQKRYEVRKGQRFGRFTVIGWTPAAANGTRRILCRCMCGQRKTLCAGEIIAGRTQSCGCLRRGPRPDTSARQLRHGHATRGRISPEYTAIKNIFQRCRNPKNTEYPNYGGRGIDVFQGWQDYAVFLQYLTDTIGLRPSPLHSLDRIHNEGNYEPGNIRWATAKEQASNRRKVGMLCQFSDDELFGELVRRDAVCLRQSRSVSADPATRQFRR